MNKARDLILELYKADYVTKEEANILLDAINKSPMCQTYTDWTYRPYDYPTYRLYEQPKWTITNNDSNTNVE